MKESEDTGKYQVNNDKTVQGQVIGDNPTVHQHFYRTGDKAISSTTPERLWMVPYRRNTFFTGRETLLTALHTSFTKDHAQGQAINGLGGIGKTQVAVEYAYRHRDAYRFVLWASAATHETLIADYVAIANGLQLPEHTLQEQDKIVAAVLRWLSTHEGWLLIVDNADELEIVLLPTGSTGHVLVTTRDQAVGDLESFPVEQMDRREGTLLLLRRAHILKPGMELEHVSPADRQVAEQIVAEMDGLPLALDQAGAYADETGCSLAKYLEYYQTQCTKLLKRRGRSSSNHPASVAATWSLSFERVEQQNAVAADLLRLCAFLAPDAIPEEIITGGAPHLGEHLQAVSEDQTLLDEAIGVLRAYSLIRRNATEKTLSIHRLVQAVLRDAMDEQSQRQWAERTVLAVSKALPPVDVPEGYLPHAQVCANLVKQKGMMTVEAARLLNNTGHYLYRYADYTKAEPLYKQGLEIYEKLRGSDHPGTVLSLKNLTKLYYAQKQYSEARSLYEQALDIMKRRGDTYPGLPAFVDFDIPLEFDLLVWNATLKTKNNNARARETDWFKEYYTLLGQEIWEAVIEFNLEESNLKKIEVIVKGGITQLDGKPGHSPISLRLNEHPAFVSNYTMPGGGVHMMAKSWDVPLEQLICGSNTLTLTVASDALSCFWLYLLYVGLKEDAIL